jgi:hypothetical protein
MLKQIVKIIRSERLSWQGVSKVFRQKEDDEVNFKSDFIGKMMYE